MRRNNAFGAKASSGIKELVENGVMIDQTNIRFDDFIASDHTSVPMPPAGEALATSYGITEVPKGQASRKDTTHILEIGLRCTDKASESQLAAPPPRLNYMFVVDVSGSMQRKLSTVKGAIRTLYERINDNDIIGVTRFNHEASTILRATPKSQLEEGAFRTLVSSLSASGSTDIKLGMSYGIDEVERYKGSGALHQIFLFSDGNPMSGETNWIKIREHLAKRLNGEINLSVFAFGTDANKGELDALAGLAGGRSTFVARPEEVTSNLEDELQRRSYLSAINVQMQLEISKDVSILHFYGHDPVTEPAHRAAVIRAAADAADQAERDLGVTSEEDLITKETGIRIFVPNLGIGDTYWVALELAVPNGADVDLGQATVQYVDAVARKTEKHRLALRSPGTLPSTLVRQHALGLWTSEVAYYALHDLYQKDLKIATDRLTAHVKMLEAATAGLAVAQLNDDIVTLKKLRTLSENLGKPRTTSEDPAGAREYTEFTLNSFGRVRSGFMMASYAVPPIGI